MRNADRPRFAAVLLAFAELHNRTPSVALTDMYWRALERFDIAAVEAAAASIMADPDAGQYWPKPADFVRHIEGGKQDAALVAWAAVDGALRRVGPYPSVTFDDPITMAVLADMGGWIGLANKSESDWPFVAKEFENRYRGYKLRSGGFAHPPVLPGINDLENVRRGFVPATPTYIGNAHKCAQVQASGNEQQRLTVSAGVAASTELARIAGPKNKRAA